jgi:hypothetical protein
LVIDGCKKVNSDKDKNHYWVYINGKEYYFKEMDNPYNELLGYNACKYLGIDACYIDLAILDGKYGIISKSLRDNGSKLVSGDELLGDYLANNFEIIRDMGFVGEIANRVKEYGLGDTTRYLSSIYINNLEIIWQALEDKYKGLIDIEKVMEQFVYMYMFTILFADIDKHPGNWYIMECENEVRLAPILDNGDILIGYEDGYEADNVIACFSTNFSDHEVNQINSLKTFFEISSYEYFLLFVSMFNKVVMNFDKIINLCEKQIGREIPKYEKEKIITSFNKNCEKIQGVINEYKKRKR